MPEGCAAHRFLFRCFWFAFVLAAAGAFSFAQADDGRWCDTLTVGGNPEYPPMLWQSVKQPDLLTGAVPALLREIVEPLGVEVVVRDVGPWARVLHMARQGKIDVVAGAFLTDERREYLDYALPPITWQPTNIWVPRGKEFKYRYWTDLRGKLGSTLIGNSFGQDFDEFAAQHLSIEGIRTIEQSFRMARLGRVDYVLYERPQGRIKLQKMGLADEFVDLQPPISSEPLYFALAKESTCNTKAFRAAFTRRLEAVTGQRRIDSLLEEYAEKYLAKAP